MVSAMNRPTMAGTVVSPKGPAESAKYREKLHSISSTIVRQAAVEEKPGNLPLVGAQKCAQTHKQRTRPTLANSQCQMNEMDKKKFARRTQKKVFVLPRRRAAPPPPPPPPPFPPRTKN
jgi:hypothetical protein